MELRDYQKEVIRDIYKAHSERSYRNLVVLPTGSGKTLIAAQICLDSIAKGQKVLVIAHRARLVSQLKNTIEASTGYKVAEIVAGNKKIDYRGYFVYVAMAQTLNTRQLPDNISHVVFDEAHTTIYLAVAKKILNKYCGSIWSLSKTRITGLTATPYRMKKKEGFCVWFTRTIKSKSVRWMINQGYLTQERSYSYSVESLEDLELESDGDYSLASLSRICGEEYNADVVQKYYSQFKEKKAIAFCSTVDQAKDLAQQFTDSGLLSCHIDGTMAESTREGLYERFKSGEIRVLVSIVTLTTGYDETSIEAVILARPTLSVALLVQMIGRGLRLHPGKTEVSILDFGGCFDRIKSVKGNPISDHISIDYSQLCSGYKQNTFKLDDKTCTNCESKVTVFARFCSNCGHEFQGKLKPKPEVITFPELLPYINPNSYNQMTWLRKRICTLFEQRKSPLIIFAEFNQKFGCLPNHDFFLGAIFNLDVATINRQKYKEYLRDCGLTVKTGAFYFSLEFGKPDRTYHIKDKEYQLPESLRETILKYQ